MPLASGTQLGPYEILSPLGAGGMGEVYRARDTRLDRTVAIKILPAHFSSDPVRKQRFDREAKTISSLNHPNICVLFDVGQQDGMDFLVMECVEGETLAARLEKGPLPLDQVLKYGAQIADALDKAHRSGIVHRDLKPANIVLSSTGAKLLDFGLARPAVPLATAATLTMAASSSPVTEEGTILGTYQYMSPEQLQGNELDARSDIFSFGAVLYEMVTGNRAFGGKSQLSVATAILEKDPEPISAVKPMLPASLDHTIRRCLAKDPEDRWQTARDLALELKWTTESGSGATSPVHLPRRGKALARAGWLLAAVLSLLLVGGVTFWWRASTRRPAPMYFHTPVPFAANDLSLSPDGHTLAMIAYSTQANNYVLWTHEVGGRQINFLAGTQGASYPFWSPDGKLIGFFADGKLKKVQASGGQVETICDAPNGRGGSWNQDGVIIFTPDALAGLSRVSSRGGTPVELTKPDASRFEASHRWPVFLPDGNHFLFMAANFSGQLEANAIFLASLDSAEKHLIVTSSANAAYAEPGYLVYLRDRTLVAQPLDTRRFVLTGEPHTLSDDLTYFPGVDRAVFSISRGAVLVTQTGKGAALSQLTWFNRSGEVTGTIGQPESINNVRLSPDGRRVAEDKSDAAGRNIDVWIREPVRNAITRLTFDPSLDQDPIWSSDGKKILFSSNRRQLGFHLYLKNADGSGSEEEIADLGPGVQTNAWDWSRDSKYMLVRKANELWYFAWPERIAKPLLQEKWTARSAQFSPDGRWIAYAANETGNMEIYVSSFPNSNGKWQVSTAGGQEPRWRGDGKELFYLSAEGKMMAVPIKTGASFEAGSPVALFQTHRRAPVSAQDFFSYDVTADGQRFLVITKVNEANPAPLSILLNWSSELEK